MDEFELSLQNRNVRETLTRTRDQLMLMKPDGKINHRRGNLANALSFAKDCYGTQTFGQLSEISRSDVTNLVLEAVVKYQIDPINGPYIDSQ